MKILAHVHGYPPNHNAGAEWMLHHMLKWLQARGHKIMVATPNPGPSEFEGIQLVKEFGKLHIRERYKWADIIISHLDRTGKCINHVRIVDKPALFIMHNTHFNNELAKIAHRSILCYNSEYTASVPFYTHKDSVIVYPPCPVDYYTTKRGGGAFITMVNLWKHKGSDMFFHLAKELPEHQFMGVRGGYGHQEKVDLDNIVYKDNQPNMKKIYQRAKVVIMPSPYESFGRVAIEAAASGIPTVAAPTPGLTEALGSAGIFVDLDDREGWVEAVNRLMTDGEYYKKMQQKVRARARKLEAMIDPQMEALVELMQRAVKNRIRNERQ